MRYLMGQQFGARRRLDVLNLAVVASGEPPDSITPKPASQIHSQLQMDYMPKRRHLQKEITPARADLSPSERTEHINESLKNLNRWVKPGTQQSLFTYLPELPEQYTLSYLGGSRIGRIHSMNLLGIAKNIADSRGVALKPSSDLSRHSLPLVSKLAEHNVISHSEVPTGTTNELDFDDNYFVSDSNLEQSYPIELDKDTISKGRETVRNVIKGSRPTRRASKPGDNPDQLQLDL